MYRFVFSPLVLQESGEVAGRIPRCGRSFRSPQLPLRDHGQQERSAGQRAQGDQGRCRGVVQVPPRDCMRRTVCSWCLGNALLRDECEIGNEHRGGLCRSPKAGDCPEGRGGGVRDGCWEWGVGTSLMWLILTLWNLPRPRSVIAKLRYVSAVCVVCLLVREMCGRKRREKESEVGNGVCFWEIRHKVRSAVSFWEIQHKSGSDV